MKVSNPKEQHFVPRVYLNGWLFNDSQVYYFEKNNITNCQVRKPEKILSLHHTYTINFDEMLILSDVDGIRTDLIDNIHRVFQKNNIKAIFNSCEIEFSNIKSKHLRNIMEWEFYKGNGKLASKRKIITELKSIRNFKIETELSRQFENNWTNIYYTFLLDVKRAKETPEKTRIIPQKSLNDLLEFLLIMMFRNPKTSLFGTFDLLNSFLPKFYLYLLGKPSEDNKEISKDETKKIKRLLFIKYLYESLEGETGNLLQLVQEIFKENRLQLVLFKSPSDISFITSDNPSFQVFDTPKQNGIYFPLSSKFLIFIGKGESSSLNKIYCKALNNKEIKIINRIIFDNSYKAIVSSENSLSRIINF